MVSDSNLMELSVIILTRFYFSRGAFDSSTGEHLPRTKYDHIIDQSSNKPGEQLYEKCVAGLYLGELFRLVMCEMTDAGVLFLGQNTYKIETAYAFDTAFLSLIERFVILAIYSDIYSLHSILPCRQ